jgi:hypothetical protein
MPPLQKASLSEAVLQSSPWQAARHLPWQARALCPLSARQAMVGMAL